MPLKELQSYKSRKVYDIRDEEFGFMTKISERLRIIVISKESLEVQQPVFVILDMQ